MKYLITGHNGFIGQTYINHIQKQKENIEILGLSRSLSKFGDCIQEKTIDLSEKGLEPILLQFSPDVIIHFASVRFGSLTDLFKSNVEATENLFNAAANLNKAVKIIIVGSSAEIGIPLNSPSTENDKCTPVDYYGLTKLMQSELAYQYYLKHGLEIVRLRLFNILGAGMPDSLLAGKAINLFHNATISKNPKPIQFGDLSSFRDYLDIRDVCNAIDKGITKGKPGELYHIGSGTKTKGTDLLDKIVKTCPIVSNKLKYTSINSRKSIVPYQVASVKKALNELKWKPRHALENTIKYMWDDILGNGK